MNLTPALAFHRYQLTKHRKRLQEEEDRIAVTLAEINRLKAQAYKEGVQLDQN